MPPRTPIEAEGHVFMVPRKGGLMANQVNPASLPPWLTEADLEVYVDQFKRTGYRGGLNWYRNIDRNYQLLAPFSGSKVKVPAILIAGDRDVVLAFRGMNQVISNLENDVPKLQKTLILPECGRTLERPSCALAWTAARRSAKTRSSASGNNHGVRPQDFEERHNFQRGLGQLAARDASVFQLLIDVRNLVKPLTMLDDPSIVSRVEEEVRQTSELSSAQALISQLELPALKLA
jgi:hypothetical protein